MIDIREKLAELEHQQWQHWMKYMIDNISNGEAVERWKKQMKTDYKDLTEKEKDSDRVWADKVLQEITKYNYETAFIKPKRNK